MRCRRYAAALTEGALIEALQSLLEPICEGTNEIAATIALDYYSTDPREKKAILAHLMLWTAPPPAHGCHECGRC